MRIRVKAALEKVDMIYLPFQDFRDKDIINAMGLKQAMKVWKACEIRAKKDGKGDSVFGKDAAIPKKSYPAGEDNCADVLHQLR